MGNESSAEAGGSTSSVVSAETAEVLASAANNSEGGAAAAAGDAGGDSSAAGGGDGEAADAEAKPKMSKAEKLAAQKQYLLRLKNSVGQAVDVVNYGSGVLRFFGLHASGQGVTCGVELDEPIGTGNGTFNGFVYFRCGEKRGILLLEEPKALELQPGGVAEELRKADEKRQKEEALAAAQAAERGDKMDKPVGGRKPGRVSVNWPPEKPVEEFVEMTSKEQKDYMKFQEKEQKKIQKTLKDMAKKKRVTAEDAVAAVAKAEVEVGAKTLPRQPKKAPRRQTSQMVKDRIDEALQSVVYVRKDRKRSVVEMELQQAALEAARKEAAELERIKLREEAEREKAEAAKRERELAENERQAEAEAEERKAKENAENKAFLAKLAEQAPRRASGQLASTVGSFENQDESLRNPVVRDAAALEAERLRQEAAGRAEKMAGIFEDPAEYVTPQITPNESRSEAEQLKAVVDAKAKVQTFQEPDKLVKPVQPNAEREAAQKLREQGIASDSVDMFADPTVFEGRPIEKTGLTELERLKKEKEEAEAKLQAQRRAVEEQRRKEEAEEKRKEEEARQAAAEAAAKEQHEKAEAARKASVATAFGGSELKKTEPAPAKVHPMLASMKQF